MSYFAKAPMCREQIVLFPTTLDEVISQDHPVRLLDEILDTVDWSSWEAEYHAYERGQPPIHPRVLAGVMLYGLMRGVRSSRRLEYMAGHNIDFIWLAHGFQPDHSTFCKFRTRFAEPLKQLFRHVGKIALTLGWIRLTEMAFDGTRIKANNGRFATWTAVEVEQALAALDEKIGQLMAEAAATDVAETSRLDPDAERPVSPELADARVRREQIEAALQKLREADAARRREGGNAAKTHAQLPTTDPDSRVLPNKEGGFAPNYTPLVATDAERGFIVDADVVAETPENQHTVAVVDRVTDTFGQQPEAVLADGLHATGVNIVALEQRGVDFYTNITSAEPQADNPAHRPDPTQNVPENAWSDLPRNPQTKKLDKSCFVYQAATDTYYCPQGQPLTYEETKSDVRQGEKVALRVYRCAGCAGCPLASQCLQTNNRGGRTITRDTYAADRERLAAKMRTPAAKEKYQRRLHAGETPFAWLKHVLGLRQFLLRGLAKVKTEFLWACTAANLAKLITELGRARGELAVLMTETAS